MTGCACLQMADMSNDPAATGESSGDKCQDNQPTLVGFIKEEYERQRVAGSMDATENIDDERSANFFKRAISESQRMNQEVVKSKEKLDKLQAEFGEEMLTEWRNEHAAEVLTPKQAAAVQNARQDAFS